MKKKNLFIVVFITILCVTFLTSSAWAGKKHRYRWEGIAIGVGAVMLGHALFKHHHHRHFHPAPPPPRFRGHWNPGHYNRDDHGR